MVTAKFDRTQSYFPVEGKLDDKFNDNFKLVVNVTNEGVTIPANAWGIGILWKGEAYIVARNDEDFETPAELTLHYADEPPTIAEFLQALGEELPSETTTYSYSWFTGFFVDEEGNIDPSGEYFAVTDEWNTDLLVIVEAFPWDKVLMAAGIGVAVLGSMVIVTRRPQYARA